MFKEGVTTSPEQLGPIILILYLSAIFFILSCACLFPTSKKPPDKMMTCFTPFSPQSSKNLLINFGLIAITARSTFSGTSFMFL